jgi:ABC-type multidrug transport system ATPase subunit
MAVTTESDREKIVEPLTIEVTDLGKKFNTEWIFRRMSYTFHPGLVYAITGPNGSGKSTFLQIIWGQMPPSLGTITYSTRARTIPVEDIFKHISVATPYMDLIEEFTLLEQLKFHFALRPSWPGLTEDEMLDKMYLSSAKDKYIGNFSSGMRQRVKLALAFFTRADILFLDEPGTNLDSQAFDWYLEQLSRLSPHCLAFIASNQPSEYPANAQKIDIMSYK